jgi:Ca2+-binding RTX toxin-like protein
MQTSLRAGTRRRTKLALLAAALLAALTVPAGADAATVSVDSAGALKLRATSGEVNSVTIAQEGTRVLVRDLAGSLTGSGQCSPRSGTEVLCASTPVAIRKVDVRLENRNDSISSRTSLETLIDGGVDNDTFFAGTAPSTSRVEYRGNSGEDTVTYASATSGVSMRQDELANDGRTALSDSDNVRRDIESFTGSPFADFLRGSLTGLAFCAEDCRGSTAFQRFSGGAGDDIVAGGTNGDIHFMGGSPDGADTITPGRSHTIVDYGGRALGVNVTIAQGARNDGAAGEGDDIGGGVDQLIGGRGVDVLSGDPAAAFQALDGGPGDDTLNGGERSDTLTGGSGQDTILGRGGVDTIFARDGVFDLVGCGTEIDTAHLDPNLDAFDSSCENRPAVGTLRLAPTVVAARAGKPAHVQLSWRHPRAWRKLRTIELRLYRDGVRVGEITVRPRAGRITADGAPKLARKHTRLTRKAKTVTARLAFRLDQGLAGQTLTAEVQATDTRGRRQLERDAATIRVAK